MQFSFSTLFSRLLSFFPFFSDISGIVRVCFAFNASTIDFYTNTEFCSTLSTVAKSVGGPLAVRDRSRASAGISLRKGSFSSPHTSSTSSEGGFRSNSGDFPSPSLLLSFQPNKT